MSDLFDFYPYAERYGVNREIPESGRSREEILGELREMATEEDAAWMPRSQKIPRERSTPTMSAV